ncbi:tetratricopeptide repeat protein [Sinirhodobacter sp. WL0062]|uniref:Tetratricopeptide repeat protein n=1 Tax=Rhodobacter flavimaris TaxID=2907145 RepID=A0ABS8YY07_9RHOB|nr:tetratricopeptide repeat protein [Sinirhodobacter sp. WL0062]MCE5974025.1 tetratricopeptide repeat protein [Sinirhodobacter sp. WL0062]
MIPKKLCGRLGVAFSLALLAACSSGFGGGGLSGSDGGPYAPGTARGDGVDGLIVGHRLVEAGEYELALKAYYRAAAKQGATVDVLSAIGSTNLKLGRLGQAEQILRRAIEVDETFVPAWNNLGVVLMEQNQVAEAARVFQTAYALDSGESDAIRDNLRLALAKMDKPDYPEAEEKTFTLVRRGVGEFLLLTQQ